MQRSSGGLVHGLKWIVILVFTSSCTINLFQRFAPPDMPWFPFAALGLLELAYISWLHYHKHVAATVDQYTYSLWLTYWSCACVTAVTALDLVLLFVAKDLLTVAPWMQQLMLGMVVLDVPVQIIGLVGLSLADPEHKQRVQSLEDGQPFRQRVVQAAPVRVQQVDQTGLLSNLKNRVFGTSVQQSDSTPVQMAKTDDTPIKRLSPREIAETEAAFRQYEAWRDQQNEQASQATLERLNEAMKMQEKRDNQSPLAMPDLETKASQNGSK